MPALQAQQKAQKRTAEKERKRDARRQHEGQASRSSTPAREWKRNGETQQEQRAQSQQLWWLDSISATTKQSVRLPQVEPPGAQAEVQEANMETKKKQGGAQQRLNLYHRRRKKKNRSHARRRTEKTSSPGKKLKAALASALPAVFARPS